MFKTILAAYDGTEPARACATLAAECAARWHGRVVLCYALDVQRLLIPAVAVPSTSFDLAETFRREAADAVVEQLRECRAAGIDCESMLRDEGSLEGILAGAAATHADLIAIGTHGRSGVVRAFLGSVAEDVLRHSDLPVLAVRSPARSGPFKNVLAAIDDSECAARGLELAEEIAYVDGCALHLLYVDVPDASTERRSKGVRALDTALERATARGVRVSANRELDQDVGSTICACAERLGAQLVVVGSHGRKGLVRAFLGSVAEWVVRNAASPVLVAKQPTA